MKNKKTNSNWIKIDRTLLILFLMFFLVTGIYVGSLIYKKNSVVEKYNIDDILEKIEKDCGSTQISRAFSGTGWRVWKDDCDSRGYCKFMDIRLEDCLE